MELALGIMDVLGRVFRQQLLPFVTFSYALLDLAALELELVIFLHFHGLGSVYLFDGVLLAIRILGYREKSTFCVGDMRLLVKKYPVLFSIMI